DPRRNARAAEPPRASDHPMNRHLARSRTHWHPAALTLLCASSAAFAQNEPLPTLEQCAAIAAASDRLYCYDRLAGRAPAPDRPTAQQAPLGEPLVSQDEVSRLLPKNAPAINEDTRS